jgi:hypothetical protein
MMLFDALFLGGLAIFKMGRMDWKLTLLTLIPMTFLLIAGSIVGNVMTKKWDARQAAYSDISDFSRLHNAILFKLRSMNEEDFKKLPDLSEGIENRFYKAVQSARNFDELLENLKTKRYTLSRIRRLVLNAALGIFESDSPDLPPYIRVLGFNNNGEDLIKEISKHSPLPVIINSKQAQSLNGVAENVFKKQNKISDLYNMTLNYPNPCGSDYSYNTIKLDIKK